MQENDRITTNAIILRTYPSGENGLVIKAFTEKHGKISIFGKGLRNNKKSQIEIIDSYYLEVKKNNKSNLYYLNHKRPISSYSNIRTNLMLISLTSIVLESFDNLIAVDEESFSENLYEELREFLVILNQKPAIKPSLQATYKILKKLMHETGYLCSSLKEQGSKKQLIKIINEIEINSEKKLNSKSVINSILEKLEI